MTTKKEIIDQLRRGKVLLPPLSFGFLEDPAPAVGKNRLDALIEASWQGDKASFVVECKSLSTPKAFQDGLNQLKSALIPEGCLPMLMMSFLREEQLRKLEAEGISGIDLCGNGVVIAPGLFSVFRGGGKNRFPASAPIKNIYRKNSSMVGRVFIARSAYDTVQDILGEINRRNLLVSSWNRNPMSLSTVSKALKTLDEDLIVGRNQNIHLIQPEKLLEKLSKNYNPPKITDRIRLKVSGDSGTIRKTLLKLSDELDLPLAATGISSVGLYAVMQRGDLLSVYCPRLELLIERLSGRETERFPNLELIETEDETVYFDARREGDFRWASPLQAYLELMAGDKRDQEIAEQVKSLILEELSPHAIYPDLSGLGQLI